MSKPREPTGAQQDIIDRMNLGWTLMKTSMNTVWLVQPDWDIPTGVVRPRTVRVNINTFGALLRNGFAERAGTFDDDRFHIHGATAYKMSAPSC